MTFLVVTLYMHIRLKLNSTKPVSTTRTSIDGSLHQIQPLARRIASKKFLSLRGVRPNPTTPLDAPLHCHLRLPIPSVVLGCDHEASSAQAYQISSQSRAMHG